MKKVSFIVLIFAFIAFIARGIPDSVLGSAWPVIRNDLSLEDTKLGVIMFIIAFFTVLMCLFSARLFGKIATEKTVVTGILITAISFVGFGFSKSFLAMCLWAVPIGTATGIMETVLNNYISLHYEARYMNFLHCFYGIGVIASPYLMSLALKGDNWRKGYFYVAGVELIIAVLVIISFPLWKKVDKIATEDGDSQTKIVSFGELIKMRPLRIMLVILFLTNVIEYTCSTWGCTYLVEAKSMSADKAAGYITLFFFGMAFGRFLSGAISEKIHTWMRIFICTSIAGAGIVITSLPLPEIATVIGFFVIGFGNGPIYPNLISLTPYNFQKEISSSVMGVQIASAFSAVMLTPLAYGLIKKVFNNATFQVFLIVSLLFMAFMIWSFVVAIKKNGMYNKEV